MSERGCPAPALLIGFRNAFDATVPEGWRLIRATVDHEWRNDPPRCEAIVRWEGDGPSPTGWQQRIGHGRTLQEAIDDATGQ